MNALLAFVIGVLIVVVAEVGVAIGMAIKDYRDEKKAEQLRKEIDGHDSSIHLR